MFINVTFDDTGGSNPRPLAAQAVVRACVSYLDHLFADGIRVNINVGWGEIHGASINAGNLGQSFWFFNTLTEVKTISFNSGLFNLFSNNLPACAMSPGTAIRRRATPSTGALSAFDLRFGTSSGSAASAYRSTSITWLIPKQE